MRALTPRRPLQLAACVFVACGFASFVGCSSDKENDEAAKQQEQATETSTHSDVSLTAEQIEKGGIQIATAKPASYVPQARGFAIVLPHDVIAQSVSDVITAAAADQQSKAALARVRSLAKTPGAFSGETLEAAERQAQADAAAYTLARRKLSASWGEHSPWGEDANSEVLAKVASGKSQLIRVTFPFGALNDDEPRQLTFQSLAAHDPSRPWISKTVWNAPADGSIPGRSLFALLQGARISEGERLAAWAPAGERVEGTLVPAAAVVIYDAQSWCYVENESGHFERRALDTQRSTDAGYFTDATVKPGDRIVVAGAAVLLAREINPSMEAD